MTPEEKRAVLRAVEALIESPDDFLFEALSACVGIAAKYPVVLVGDAEVMNPLLHLSTKDFAAYVRVLDLVDAKRAAVGKQPLRRQESGYDKTAYMKDFMAQKRERQRRAADIENMARSEKDKLVGRSRLDFIERQSAIWKEERDAFMDKVRSAHNGRVPKDVMNTALAQFWAAVDKSLDEKEELAMRRIRDPRGPREAPTSLLNLIEAVIQDPYKK